MGCSVVPYSPRGVAHLKSVIQDFEPICLLTFARAHWWSGESLDIGHYFTVPSTSPDDLHEDSSERRNG